MEKFKILKIKRGIGEVIEDVVAGEVPFTVVIGNKELVTLLCTPKDLEDLTSGFLFTSGLIKRPQDIKSLVVDVEKWRAQVELINDIDAANFVFKRLYTSGCGRGTMFYNVLDLMNRKKIISNFKIKAEQISKLMVVFQKKSEIFLETGGVHSAAISNVNDIVVFREDIGRHNAIDKAIGNMLRNGVGCEERVIITSGRISSEVLFKVKKCRIPIIISRSAPTNQAVRLAREMGITIIGFARGIKMNVYSNEERVVL